MADFKHWLQAGVGIFCKYLMYCFSLFLLHAKFNDARGIKIVI